jgi:hypothetical protein
MCCVYNQMVGADDPAAEVGTGAEDPRLRRNEQEKPISHDGRRSKGSPDRAASLGSLGPHARPCPDDRHSRAVSSFRNNSVPEDESHAKLPP